MTPPERVHDRCITPEGFAKLQAELRELWRVERPRVTREVQYAASLGDRSENAEYQYGKKRLREIDARVRHLTRRLEELRVVRPGEVDEARVYFGAWVTLEDETGGELRYRLVGPDESDVEAGLISIESPVGRGLVGREEGDEVEVRRPAGLATFTIRKIAYESGDAGA